MINTIERCDAPRVACKKLTKGGTENGAASSVDDADTMRALRVA